MSSSIEFIENTHQRSTRIAGVGIDLVDVARIARSLAELGPRFLERIAHPAELADAPNTDATGPRTAQYWAARFAAKEAFAKALGTGIGATVALKSVGVVRNHLGAPRLGVDGPLKTLLEQRGIVGIHVSLSHTEHAATALVVLESAAEGSSS